MSDQLQVRMEFPPDFLWGTATASHQVEGGNHNSWSAWENLGGGRIYKDQVSGLACDWWNGRATEDFARAASMHNNALRLSIEWSRVEPEPGQWDTDALDHYRQMVIDLRQRGLEPMVTLHHFSNPVWLEERGAWLDPETPRLFGRYAARVADALGDHVRLWCTINEPMVYAVQGYIIGKWPPGRRSLFQVLTVAAHLVEGHAAAYHAIKAKFPAAQIGLAKHQVSFKSYMPLLGDAAAWLANYAFNEMFPLTFVTGKMRTWVRGTVSIPQAKGTLDWIGLQYYSRFNLRFSLMHPGSAFFDLYVPPGAQVGPEDWGELAPQDSLPRIAHLYELVRKPIYVTEMGVPDEDDSIRPGYLARTLQSVWRACAHNYPVKGFFYWSLVDNFEWAEGYDPRYRFGLFGVDFATQAREERRSARLYRDICGANALTADMVRTHAPDVYALLFPQPETVAE